MEKFRINRSKAVQVDPHQESSLQVSTVAVTNILLWFRIRSICLHVERGIENCVLHVKGLSLQPLIFLDGMLIKVLYKG